MSMDGKYSVLIPVYWKENPEFLKESLDSLIRQSLRPAEIVLVEDGPVGEELHSVISDYKKKHQNLRHIQLQENQGLGKALNEGLKYCSFDLVARMDSDDISKPYRMQKQMEIFQKYPEVDVVSSWIDEFEDEPSLIKSIRKLPEYPFEIFSFAKRRCPINHPAVMFRKDAVMLAGGYRHFRLFEDYYLWVRMLLNGSKFYNIQESLLWFRTSSDMYKRRGGLKHALNEVRFQNLLRKMHFISLWQEISNILIRFTARVIPNNFRKFVYENYLRK